MRCTRDAAGPFPDPPRKRALGPLERHSPRSQPSRDFDLHRWTTQPKVSGRREPYGGEDLGMPNKTTGKKAASRASKTMTGSGSKRAKSAAGSALSQTKAPAKVTSAAAASKASKVLRSPKSSAQAKSAAASALAQREKKK